MIYCSTHFPLCLCLNIHVFTVHRCVPSPQLIELFSQLGVDGLLVEYEDMFPYDGELKLLQATAQPAYRYSSGHEHWMLLYLYLTLFIVCVQLCVFIYLPYRVVRSF